MTEDRLDWRTKGAWQPGAGVPFAEFAAGRTGLFDGAFTWPVMVLRATAVEHNLAALAGFCRRHGFDFAPHGKTTMSPSLFQAQLEAGAWAITVATANQVLACRSFGLPRVLLANELLDSTALRWIGGEIARGFDFLCFVDSVAGVQAIARAMEQVPGGRSMQVFAEWGFAGGRAGCRTVDQLAEVAAAADAAPRVELVGVAGYEGGLPGPGAAAAYLTALRESVVELSRRGLLPPHVIVSAGGSTYFDVVAEALGGDWLPGHEVRTVLRSGAYLSHDHGFYHDRTPFLRVPEEGSLSPALEIWAQVGSTPEPGLVIAGLGKRDAPIDEGMPVPLRHRTADGVTHELRGWRVAKLNDHHAYVEVPPEARVSPGDLICFGISHPCTAFDKWRVIPVVAEDYTVTDLLRTYF
ncbi:D-serine deaminase-like pyridoxal phosphate-dependent protein [Allocatelliglobosispora scoriae]|uniref:D-serine deaminase-like pyridoxal phosphate-dependent protein n=1 Tax=Allocatelliglobosispora scoriae TaxID=643052 RepID=A0A841BNF0_9ACTN|nr:alanine racemase [Allocatelliglobosispora scoriae]MBB5868483.1 D-serine deaminase-like pyridoxal phosphate-dependent protein [Allocatelliglobosispora scoriae]